jgi:hypothetical protein
LVMKAKCPSWEYVQPPTDRRTLSVLEPDL